MMAATPEKKFNAAVKVIRGLPKNGAFQPSHELMLKFYAYFKQATEGPCTAPKPGIWNLVNRKKWEAWSELGQMEKETAMLLYVDELKNVSKHVRDTLYPPEIVETMPQTEHVAEFVETLGAFYELIEEGPVKGPAGDPGVANGSDEFSGEEGMDHSACIGEMLKINNNDAKKNSSEKDDTLNSDRANVSAGTSNGLDHTREENKGQDNGEGEEDLEETEEEEEKGLDDNTRLDSGSDTDEFCDTSDQLIQVPPKLSSLQPGLPHETSTPVDSGKRETRVRFAPHINTTFPTSEGDAPDAGAALPDTSSVSPQQLLASRLGLGSTTGFSFLPQSTDPPLSPLTESLRVNNSFSSLASLAGNDSVAGDIDEVDEGGAMLDGANFTSAGHLDLLTSRGGKEEDAPSSQATQGSNPLSAGASASALSRGRDSGRDEGRHSRRDQRPPGSGSGGQRDGGEGHWAGGSLDEQILLTLIRLQQDIADISKRLTALELSVKQQREEDKKAVAKSDSRWWPFKGMSKSMVFLLFVWPFLAPFLINVVCARRRRR